MCRLRLHAATSEENGGRRVSVPCVGAGIARPQAGHAQAAAPLKRKHPRQFLRACQGGPDGRQETVPAAGQAVKGMYPAPRVSWRGPARAVAIRTPLPETERNRPCRVVPSARTARTTRAHRQKSRLTDTAHGMLWMRQKYPPRLRSAANGEKLGRKTQQMVVISVVICYYKRERRNDRPPRPRRIRRERYGKEQQHRAQPRQGEARR